MADEDEFIWDPELRVYRRRSSGGIVSESDIDSMIDDALANLAVYWRNRATDFRDGVISFDEFFNGTRAEIESMNLAMIALAFGGVSNTRDIDFRRLQQAIEDQISFFQQFALQIQAGLVTEAMTGARLDMYALAGYGTYQNATVVREIDANMKIYRRLLGAADHCDDCVEYASRGWQVIGTLPGIGQSVCRSRCHCYFQYSNNLNLLGQGGHPHI